MRLVIFLVLGVLLGSVGGGAWVGLKQRDALLASRAEAARAEEARAEEARAEEARVEEARVEEAAVTEEDRAASPEAGDGERELEGGATPDEGDPHDPGAPGSPDLDAEDQPADEGVEGLHDVQDPRRLATAREDAPEGGVQSDSAVIRLSKMFGSMKAADAAAVLELLSDREVEAILMRVGNRQAAQILGTLDPNRAAAVSRALLNRGGSS